MTEHVNQVRTRTFVVGTAGHVDHGKSTLVKTLTGIDPDRLREEREREMTIDLGFAWLDLPGGLQVSVVDVPGHERFIKNMLAGVGGIDAAILVVAADEGPMPQTAEHLAILDLLEVEHGVIALTKRDLVDDEWLELIIEETRDRLTGTALSSAAIVPVSSTTREGFDRLLAELAAVLTRLPERESAGRARLPIDRAFTVAGFGTVVTGTLLGGSLDVGQEVELLPRGTRTRVRGLQSHGRSVERATPGARTAINLSGVERELIERGDVVALPGWLAPTTILDARLRIVADAPRGLEQNDAVDFFTGAAEAAGHVTLLDRELLLPGEDGWVQLRLARPIVAAPGDRFIIRQPSPSLTIGGGRIIDAHPRRHRRFRADVITALETRATGTPEERLSQLLANSPLELRAAAEQLEISLDDVRAIVCRDDAVIVLGATGEGAIAPSRLLIARDALGRLEEAVTAMLSDFHRRQPLRRGAPKEEVKSRLALTPRAFDALIQTLVARGAVRDLGHVLTLPDFQITLSSGQRAIVDQFISALQANPNSPPSPSDFGIGTDLLAALHELGMVVRLPDNVVFGAEQLAEIQRETLRLIDAHSSITLAQFRDHFGSSRKYAQAVLEYFDQQRITRRVGDARVRGSG